MLNLILQWINQVDDVTLQEKLKKLFYATDSLSGKHFLLEWFLWVQVFASWSLCVSVSISVVSTFLRILFFVQYIQQSG